VFVWEAARRFRLENQGAIERDTEEIFNRERSPGVCCLPSVACFKQVDAVVKASHLRLTAVPPLSSYNSRPSCLVKPHPPASSPRHQPQAMRVEIDFEGGKNSSGIYVHKRLPGARCGAVLWVWWYA